MIKFKMVDKDVKTLFTAIGKLKATLASADSTVIERSARNFSVQLKKNIVEQTFGDFGVPFTPKWKAQKEREGNHPGEFWLYKGLLLKQIQIRKVSANSWWVGIVSSGGYKNNPKIYGHVLEDKRPLFEKTKDAFIPDWNAATMQLTHRIKESLK